MTGQKNRYTTTEKLWKLDDTTLSTPKHDEMVLWLLDNNNMLSLDSKYAIGIYDFINKNEKYNIYLFGDYLITNQTTFEFTSNECIESIIERISEGIVKRCAYYGIPFHNITEEIELGHNLMITHYRSYSSKSEIPITANNGFLVGYVDIDIELIDPIYTNGLLWFHRGDIKEHNVIRREEKEYNRMLNRKHHIYIEVKPKIDSFGTTLRQLNTYKHYLNTENLYLFTTDLGFKSAFESQGIKVLTYPESIN